MDVCYVCIEDSEGQKMDVFVKFIKRTLDGGLLLKKSVLAQKPGSMKPRDHAGQFLDDCLVNRLLSVSEDPEIAMRHLVRTRHHRLKLPEDMIQYLNSVVVEGIH